MLTDRLRAHFRYAPLNGGGDPAWTVRFRTASTRMRSRQGVDATHTPLHWLSMMVHLSVLGVLTTLLVGCQQVALSDQRPNHELIVTVGPPGARDTELDRQTVRGTIVVSISQEGWMREVRFYLDGDLEHTLRSAPFELEIDTTELTDGPHTIGIEALMSNGRIHASETVEFYVSNTTPPPTEETEEIDDEPTEEPTAPSYRGTSLRGDPNFSRNQLNQEQRTRYDRVWQEINDHNAAITTDAKSGDSYTYSREYYSHIQAVLLVFRLTGDLALLDYVDTLAQHMRNQLADGWYGTLDGTDGTTDGYLNWVDKRTSSSAHRGKDTWRANEMGTHALVATIAYALHTNRDLTSPTSRNYAAHADFWKDYLVNHFEAKWRQRAKVPTAFPIITNPHTTTYYKWMAWHYYMGQLTGHNAYTNEATRMADAQWAEHFPIETAQGPAYVWARSLDSLGGNQSHLLHPTTYARHVYGLSVDFHLEGFHNWASPETMTRFARTFTTAIIDNPDPIQNGMAADVGGEKDTLHLVSDDGWSRMQSARFADSNYGFIGAWDDTGEIRALTDTIQDIYDGSRDTTRLAGALFLDSFSKLAAGAGGS